jgi:hypothetical protein
MPKAAQKDDLPAAIKTYDRAVEIAASKIGRTRDSSADSKKELSRLVKERADEIADLIISKAGGKK